MSSPLEYYLALRYPIELVEDPDGGFVAKHPELEGCVAQGESPDVAVAALAEARRLWLETRFEDGLPIPEPREEEEHSGRFVLRVPRSVHARLARRASKEGVSLNQYIATVLSEHLGGTTTRAESWDSYDDIRMLVDTWANASELSHCRFRERLRVQWLNHPWSFIGTHAAHTFTFKTLNARQGGELGWGELEPRTVFRSGPNVLTEMEQA